MNKENKTIKNAVVKAVKIDDKKIALAECEEAIDELQKLNSTKEIAVNELKKNNKENKVNNKKLYFLTIFSLLIAAASLVIALLSLFI
jgi:hypothetical protein